MELTARRIESALPVIFAALAQKLESAAMRWPAMSALEAKAEAARTEERTFMLWKKKWLWQADFDWSLDQTDSYLWASWKGAREEEQLSSNNVWTSSVGFPSSKITFFEITRKKANCDEIHEKYT